MRLELVLLENAPNRALSATRQAGKPGFLGVCRYLPRQGRERPQFRRQPHLLGLHAGDAYHPGFGLLRNLRRARAVKIIFQAHPNSARQRFVDAFVDRRTTDAQGPLYFADREALRVAEQNPGALHFPYRCRPGARQLGQQSPLLLSQNQCRTSALSPHDHLPIKYRTEA